MELKIHIKVFLNLKIKGNSSLKLSKYTLLTLQCMCHLHTHTYTHTHTRTQHALTHTTCTLLYRYLENIVSHPGEDKYSKIRMNNKAFSERVCSVEGAVLFLEAVGFQQKLLPHGSKQYL